MPRLQPLLAPRVLIALCALLACVHVATFLGAGPVDDDFIVYRYARNLLAGDGLVFNPGERFEGFTVPLWLAWIAAGLALGLDPVVVSQWTSLVAAGLAVFLLGIAWHRRFPAAKWPAPALVVAAMPGFAFHGAAGLGTTLLAALLCLWLVLYESAERAGRTAWGAGVALALACLLRQECGLFAVPFLFFEARRGRAAGALPALVALAGWTAFRLVYYGRILPMTYDVKKLPLLVDLGYGWRYLWIATLTSGVGMFALVAAGTWRRACASNAARAALAGALAHVVYVVYVGGDFMLYARFFQPTLPLLVYFACAGLHQARADGLFTVVALVLPQWTQLVHPAHSGGMLAVEGRVYARALHDFNEKRWIELGRYFEAVLAPDTKVALSPIGAFGWYSGLPIVDVLGLTNASAVGVEPDLATTMKGHHRSDPAYVLDQRPDLVILGNGVREQGTGRLVVSPWERELVLHPRFQEGYVRMVLPISNGEPLDVFRRKDAQPPPGALVFYGR